MLKDINTHQHDSVISLDEATHIYTIRQDKSYKSVTTFVKSLFKKFDSDLIIDKMMKSKYWPNNKYYGKTKEEIKEEWKQNGLESSALGTRLHLNIEYFYNNILDKTMEFTSEFEMFLKFYDNNKHLVPYRTEWLIFDEDLKMAGSIDMVFKEEKDGNTYYHIYDWKRSKDIKKDNKYGNCLIEELNYIPDSNFWHYSLQLNIYKYILEKNYSIKIKDMFLVQIHPNKTTYQKHKVYELNNEIQALINYRKLNT